jgi:tetratricopeptide (TPR) repeat protein
LFLGNEVAYRRARTALLDRIGEPKDWIEAERSSLACLLLPASGDELRRSVGLADRAVAAAEKSREPGNPYVQFVKGLAEYRQGRHKEAMPWLEQSVSGLPNRPGPRLVLAMAQFQSGSAREARRTLAAGVQVYPWNESPPASRTDLPFTWVSHVFRREAEALILPNLSAFLEGRYQPQDNDERLALVGICQFQGRCGTVARLFADAFGADPHLADDLNKACLRRAQGKEAPSDRLEVFDSGCRYLAARCAALAGCGPGNDREKFSEEERARWRQQARDWLHADVAAWAKMLDSDSGGARDLAKRMLERWQVEPDLAGLHDPEALDRLPSAERQECRMLWKDIVEVHDQVALAPHPEDTRGVNDEGFVRRWLVLAPISFDETQSGSDGLDKEQIKDEAKLEVKAGDKVKVGDKDFVWKEHTCKEYALDFNFLLGAQTEHSVAYAVSYIFAPEQFKGVKMKTGSDDQAKVYLNGKQVFKHANTGSLEKDADVAEVTLQKGFNIVVAKVVNETGDWAFCLRFTDKDDYPLTNLMAESRNQATDQPANTASFIKLAAVYVSTGRTRAAVPKLVIASATDPKDTLLSLKVAALQAWFGQDTELVATRRRLFAFAKDTKDAIIAERAAKACSIVPSAEKAELEAAIEFGRAAVKLGKGADARDWCLMALGMAEFRSGNYAGADETLLAAEKAGPTNRFVTGTSPFYRAMSLFQQGKEEEARKLAIAAAAKMKPLPKDENNPLAGDADHDDLILWLAYKEAKAMIKFEPVSPPKSDNDKK